MSKSPVWDQVGHAAQGAAVVLPMLFLVQTLSYEFWVPDPEAVSLCSVDVGGILRQYEVVLGCRYYGPAEPTYKVILLSALCAGIALFWRELSQLRRSNRFKAWLIEKNWDSIWYHWHLGDRLLDIAFGAIGGAALGGVWVLAR